MDKPGFLYHGSSSRNITLFEPRAESVRDPHEGPVIFATPDKTIATMFIISSNNSWTQSGLFREIHYFVCSNEKMFRKLDKGGAIYTFDSGQFENDPNKGLRTKEWTSKIPVKPIAKEEFDSALDEMINAGVQVYFVNEEAFQKIEKSSDHGNEILRNTVSENMKRNQNIKILPIFKPN